MKPKRGRPRKYPLPEQKEQRGIEILPPEEAKALLARLGASRSQIEAVDAQGSSVKTLDQSFSKEISLVDMKKKESGARDLLTKEQIETKTDIKHKEIVAATRLIFIAERYRPENTLKNPEFGIKEFVYKFLELKVSKDRQGRREFIEGLHAEERRDQNKDMGPLRAFFDNLNGGNP